MQVPEKTIHGFGFINDLSGTFIYSQFEKGTIRRTQPPY